MTVRNLCLAQDAEADQLLSESPLALLIGMVLDQQIPLEVAFLGGRRRSSSVWLRSIYIALALLINSGI